MYAVEYGSWSNACFLNPLSDEMAFHCKALEELYENSAVAQQLLAERVGSSSVPRFLGDLRAVGSGWRMCPEHSWGEKYDSQLQPSLLNLDSSSVLSSN